MTDHSTPGLASCSLASVRITAPSPVSTQSLPPQSCSETGANLPPPNERTAYMMPGTMTSSALIAADQNITSYARGHYTDFPTDEPLCSFRCHSRTTRSWSTTLSTMGLATELSASGGGHLETPMPTFGMQAGRLVSLIHLQWR
jgi:hypothetical protein